MHILIIPSEEFLPINNHLSGIFQKHQALALQNMGCRVGIISVRQSLSIPMLIKAILFRCIGKETKNELNRKSIKVLFQYLFQKLFTIQKFINIEHIEGLDIFRIDGFYYFPPNKHTNHIGWLKAGQKVFEEYCKINGVPDVIHAHNAVYAGILANRISKKEKIPYVITEHSSFVARNLESIFLTSKIKAAYFQASLFFVVSEFLGTKIDKLFHCSFGWKELPNVLDQEIEKEQFFIENKSQLPFTFINIASLIPLKRQTDLINAFNLAFKGNENVKLKIAGDGILKNELQSEINKLGLQSQMTLTDRLERKEIIKLIDASNCLILTSDIETFGVVLIEALSRGKPVISSKCGGPQSIINTENGLLYDVGDISELSNNMILLKENYSNYDFQKIRIEALQKYGSKQFASRLINEYETVI